MIVLSKLFFNCYNFRATTLFIQLFFGEGIDWYPDKFAKIYLNHYVPARYARHHYDLFKALPHGAQGEKANILAPRGSAKLTLMAVIFPIYRICYAKYNEIIILNFLPSIPHTNTFICKIGFDTVNREFPVVRDRGNNRSIRIAFHKNIT